METDYWEYKIIEITYTPSALAELLNKEGQNGWRLKQLVLVIGHEAVVVLEQPTIYYGEPCDPDMTVS